MSASAPAGLVPVRKSFAHHLCTTLSLARPGLIWVRDLMVGDVMVDRSFRVERFRPLGLSWAATLAWEPRAFLELAGSFGAILELWAVERWSGNALRWS